MASDLQDESTIDAPEDVETDDCLLENQDIDSDSIIEDTSGGVSSELLDPLRKLYRAKNIDQETIDQETNSTVNELDSMLCNTDDSCDEGEQTKGVKYEDPLPLYMDPNQTKQQEIRDCEITNLLQVYVIAYKNKTEYTRKLRDNIIHMCWFIIVFVVSISVGATCAYISGATQLDLVALVSAYITLIVAISKVLNTITAYAFPKDDEKYITKIVNSIQENDLENKRENIRAKGSEHNDV